MIAAAIGGGMQIAGGVIGAVASIRAARENSKIMKWNASLKRKQARDVVRQGFFEENQKRIDTRRVIGAQRSGFAAQGVVVDDATGTTGEVTQQTEQIGDLEAMTIRNNAALQAWGLETEAAQLDRGAAVTQSESYLNAGAILLGSSGQAAQSFSRMA